jgi:hypothetical protein
MIRRWLPSSSTKRRISDFLKHRTSLHDTAARQQLTVNCSSRGYARMIEAHADPRSEALCRSPKRGGGAQITDATRRERELRGELVRCKIVPYVEPVAARPAARTCACAGPALMPALRRTVGTGPARHRVPACGPRSQEQEDDPVEVLYMPTPVPKYRAHAAHATSHLSHTQHATLHRLDRQHTAVCMRGTPAADARAAASASQSHSLECQGPRTATRPCPLAPGGRGPDPAQ